MALYHEVYIHNYQLFFFLINFTRKLYYWHIQKLSSIFWEKAILKIPSSSSAVECNLYKIITNLQKLHFIRNISDNFSQHFISAPIRRTHLNTFEGLLPRVTVWCNIAEVQKFKDKILLNSRVIKSSRSTLLTLFSNNLRKWSQKCVSKAPALSVTPGPNCYLTTPAPNLCFASPALNLYLLATALNLCLPVLQLSLS